MNMKIIPRVFLLSTLGMSAWCLVTDPVWSNPIVSEKKDVFSNAVPQQITLDKTNKDNIFLQEENINKETAKPAISSNFDDSGFDSHQSPFVSPEEGMVLRNLREQIVNRNSSPYSNSSNSNSVHQIRKQQLNRGFLKETNSKKPMNQVTNVNELKDVDPTDWAYESLRSLVERYGCIVGYPDRTFRGNRSLSRYEFAAGLNACLNTIERLIQENVAVLREDIETFKRLSQEFEMELAALGAKVDNLESRVAYLEDHQFSTTVYFGGEVIMGLTDGWGGSPPGTGKGNSVLNYLLRYGGVTTFTGKDRLRFTLASGNFDNSGFANATILNTYGAFLSYQDGLRSDVIIDALEYRTAIATGLRKGDDMVLTFRPHGFSLSSVLSANSRYFDVGRGAISRFAEASPIYKIGALDGGFGIDWLLHDRIRFQAAYGTQNIAQPQEGINRSDHSALGLQLLINPTQTTVMGLTYVNSYTRDGFLNTFTGSFNADSSGLILEPSQINAGGLTFQWNFLENLTFGAWGAYMVTNSHQSDKFATTSTYLVSLGWSDVLKEGNELVFMFGQPPKVERTNGSLFGSDRTTAYHYELFYRYQLSDRISITPGFFWVSHPGSRNQNNTIYIGTIRTTFRF